VAGRQVRVSGSCAQRRIRHGERRSWRPVLRPGREIFPIGASEFGPWARR
jgi:hypothetical protein